ncbi:MAG: thiamine-phosphate kinase [Pseudomonadota bacterium]
MSISEFDLIQRFFDRKKSNRADVICGIGDDGALLQCPAGQQLVVTTDTLVAGKHFPENTPPGDIAYKALSVNLSDLAAMGAEPSWILLALTLPTVDESWLKKFTQDFFSLLDRFQCQLVGGDLTQGPLSITIQALGFVPVGKALRRSGAGVGDKIYVTGTLGDAGLALAYLQNKTSFPFTEEQIQFLKKRLHRPEPRVVVGLALRDIASSAIDISDGLAADLGHILSASAVGAKLDVSKLPLSDVLQKLPPEEGSQFALSSGDDYELCFTVPASQKSQLQRCLKDIACPYAYIGTIKQELGLSLYCADGSLFSLKESGFQHFYN